MSVGVHVISHISVYISTYLFHPPEAVHHSRDEQQGREGRGVCGVSCSLQLQYGLLQLSGEALFRSNNNYILHKSIGEGQMMFSLIISM